MLDKPIAMISDSSTAQAENTRKITSPAPQKQAVTNAMMMMYGAVYATILSYRAITAMTKAKSAQPSTSGSIHALAVAISDNIALSPRTVAKMGRIASNVKRIT